MPRFLQKTALICFALAITACAALVPNKHLITKERLIGTMQKRFPLHKGNANDLYNVTLDVPQLTLAPELNKVRFEGNFNGTALMFKLDGHYAFSSELQYDATKHAVFLHEPQFDSLQLMQGQEYEEILRTLLNQMVKEFARKEPLYSFKPEELVVLGERVEIEGIEVKPEGILLKIKTLH